MSDKPNSLVAFDGRAGPIVICGGVIVVCGGGGVGCRRSARTLHRLK